MVVGEGVRLDEARRISRAPGTLDRLPLTRHAQRSLKVVRHVLRQRRLDHVQLHVGPRAVVLLENLTDVRVHASEAAKRLIGS